MKLKESKNASIEEVEEIVTHILDNTEETLNWSTGLFIPFFKRERVEASILDAARRLQSFNLILDYYVDVEKAKQELPWLFELANAGRIEIRQSPDRVGHWMIGDRKRFLRLEKPHLEDTYGANNHVLSREEFLTAKRG